MKHSVNRILTTHVGCLSRPTDLIQMYHTGPIRYTGTRSFDEHSEFCETMKKCNRDPIREDRIHGEAIADADPGEQAVSWYYYLESKISFPFQARCIAAKPVSPLRKGETVEVVQIRRQGRRIPVPPSQLATIDRHELAEQAIGDWHSWSCRAAFSGLISQTDKLAASE
jgi:Calcium binding